MDFQPQIKYILPTGTPMPFFMAYPDYPCIGRQSETADQRLQQDFEYLRRTYPAIVGRYQRRVEEILDTVDYDGSMIYDEYPDRLSLLELGKTVAGMLAGMEEPSRGDSDGKRGLTEKEEAYLTGLAQVLVCNEIYRRRQKRRR